MELNAEQIRYKMSEEQIKTALKCLSKPNSSPADREKCYFMWKEPSCLSCYHEVAQNALALITSQEQRMGAQDKTISELRKLLEKANHDADRYAAKIKELTAGLEAVRSRADETIDALHSEVRRLTEENERLHETCTEFERKCASLNDENEKIGIENFDLVCELSRIKEDTVRKMQERFHKRFRSDRDAIYTGYNIHRYIDQIAKETVEGSK